MSSKFCWEAGDIAIETLPMCNRCNHKHESGDYCDMYSDEPTELIEKQEMCRHFSKQKSILDD